MRVIGWLSLLALTGSLVLACREQPAAPTGHVLYVRHCAACHGPSGEGDGPLAASLKRRPADLTRIAERAGGRFDEAAVMQVVDGRRGVAEHGPRDMPVWGAVFADDLGEERWGFYTAMLHARALTDYLGSIQRPR